MYHMRNLLTAIIFIAMVLLAGNRIYMPFGKEDGSSLAKEVSLMQKAESDPLFKEIKQKANEYNEEPENAYLDRVWKKTPGRNGLQVNVQASYKQMKKNGTFTSKLLVKDEVKPAIQLDDLPASPIYRGHPKKEMTALLINVSWGEEYIPQMLKTLKDEKVKASFFIEGKWAKKHPDMVKMIADEGHLIGSHAYNHPDMAKISQEEITYQIAETNTILEAMIGKKPIWFAPPSGSFNQNVVDKANQEGMHTILWTVDTIDWKNPTVSVMVKRIEEKVHPGATILMHPTRAASSGLPEMIKLIKQKDLRLGTIENLTSSER